MCVRVAIIVLLTTGLWGCADKRKPVAVPVRPPIVTVAKPVEMEYQPHADFTGRTDAVEQVEVRPRVSGFLDSIFFQPGAEVKQGDVLFEIDPRPYKAEVERLEAELARTKAVHKETIVEHARIVDLADKDSATQLELDRHVASRDSAEAQVAAAGAALDRANLDLEWTKVAAPIGGRISRNYVDAGNLVQGGLGTATLLTRIVKLEPMHAYMDVDERTLLLIQKMIREGKMPRYSEGRSQALLGLAIEDGFPHEGGIDFVENKVDPNTGTLRVRAVFPNPDNVLSPGLFARIRVLLGPGEKTLMVSERAISFDQGQRFVYVVNDKNAVEYRVVQVGDLENGLRVIEAGVGRDDWVIVNGLQRVRPGATVEPQRVEMLSLVRPEAKSTGPATDQPADTTTQPH